MTRAPPSSTCAELRRDHGLLAPARQGATHELLVDAVLPVDVGRVEQRDAELERTVNRGGRLVLIARAVEGRHAHAAETEARDLEARRAERAAGQPGHVYATIR